VRSAEPRPSWTQSNLPKDRRSVLHPTAPALTAVRARFVVLAGALALMAALCLPAIAGAAACPNEHHRKGPSALLPDCRAYEQVSPVDKNGGGVSFGHSENGVLSRFAVYSAARHGRSVSFAAPTEFADARHGGSWADTPYLATRGGEGWTTSAISPPLNGPPVVAVTASTPDLGRSLLFSEALMPTDPPTPSTHVDKMYDRDNVTAAVGYRFGLTTLNSGWELVAPVISEDGNHMAFGTAAVLTSDPMPDDTYLKVYESTADGLRLASVDSDGTAFGHAGVGSSGEISGGSFSSYRAISQDGRHIFFNATRESDTFAPRELYRRSDGTTTVSASPSKLSPRDPEGVKTKIFRLASSDGSRVLFTSSEHLTEDANTGPTRAGTDLYRYDVEADELVNLSATPGGDGARVEGVVAADEAGDRVYYVALGRVVPGQGSSSGDQPNLYLWEDDGSPSGSTRFIATLAASDALNWIGTNGTGWLARVSSDGGQLLFQSDADIPGHDNGGVRQVYHYDADTDTLSCASCNPTGDTPLGPASIPGHVAGERTQPWEHSRALSDDGRRVFFSTKDDLVVRDSNGEVDPYMWQDGEVSLLSTGTSARESHFYNASADGDDVFILTSEQLVAQDTDDLVDLYDARIGGGFPAPARRDCDGEACQGDGAADPPPASVGSADLQRAGDAKPGRRLNLRLARLSRAQLQRLAAGRRIGVRVRVSGPARVRIVARKLRGARPVVAVSTAQASKAGRLIVSLRLRRAARRDLRRGASMRLSLSVRAPDARPRTAILRLRGTS
jgi:hypothetical protein